ncbi:hypothetical protein ABT160_04525 [Streptomyces sp. NPDC001941]|uniref:hypothetical protein n=1 Tax=Streptomyces sp. NPDC001941 TaxID=3154659 RepID=UPI00332F3DE3
MNSDELPPVVTLSQASQILGISAANGLALAKIDGYPLPLADVPEGYGVGTADLVRHAGEERVREVLQATV